MKLRNSEMIQIVNNITAIQSNELQSEEKRFVGKIKASYALKKNRDKILELLKPYEEERLEIFERFKIDKNGSLENLSNDEKEALLKELNVLLSIEVDVPVYKVNIEDIEGINLSFEELDALDFMINDPVELRS